MPVPTNSRNRLCVDLGLRTDGVDGLLVSRLSDKEKKRQEVIFELIETERDYLRDLDMIVEVCARVQKAASFSLSLSVPPSVIRF